MDFSSFVLKVALVYLIYYSINVLYDLFIKKDNSIVNIDNDRVINFNDIIQEETVDVKDYVEPIMEEKYDNTISNNISIPSERIEQEKTTNPISDSFVIVDDETDNDEIDLPIEGQSIPFETLLREGRELFSNVNF